ncbi:MAG: methylated-DNA--[protein]-cysteine S-methyltransferase [Planctomycetes bacterium]|nr:methylated-DNA--[protein]-cysteine S-methyltransferase [Planctomycetota bacterium]MCK5472878.1 methylated-DNA--[protein]-cysteine S-methyltransferase [Planctomycetota bacterium]
MEKELKYTIFPTEWGYFGLVGTDNALFNAFLPTAERGTLRNKILADFHSILHEKDLFKPVQQRIVAYFQGERIDFGGDIEIELYLDSFFAKQVLVACRDIAFGQTRTYLDIAKRLGKPRATRAVGAALAKNPLPLIVPCHRVLRSDGQIGGFSAGGGAEMKAKLLEHERNV